MRHKGDGNRKKIIAVGLVLSAGFTTVGVAHAYLNYPWCAFGEGRGRDCVFASKEQCSKDGRGRGFGGQCVQNSAYNPALGPVVGAGYAKPSKQGQRKSYSR